MKRIRIKPMLLVAIWLLFSAPVSKLYALHTEETASWIEKQSISKEKYQAERLEAIAKVAGLTPDEKRIVSEELQKYDKVRFECWKGIRKVYKKMSQLGDKSSTEQYRKAFARIQELTKKRHEATQQFMETLSQQLSPEKAFLTYESYNQYNSSVGRQIRQRQAK